MLKYDPSLCVLAYCLDNPSISIKILVLKVRGKREGRGERGEGRGERGEGRGERRKESGEREERERER